MILLLEITVVVVLFAIVVRTTKRAFRRHQVGSADLICSVLFVFYALPLVYQWFVPVHPPPWFFDSTTSPGVQLKYCLVILIAVMLIKLGAYRRLRPQHQDRQAAAFLPVRAQPTGLVSLVIVAAWALLLLPLAAVLVSGMANVFLTYGRVVHFGPSATPAESFFIGLVHLACLVAVLGFFLLDWLRARQNRPRGDPIHWIAFAFAVMAVYIHGKRALAFALCMVVIIVRFFEGRLRLRTCVVLGLLLMVGSYLYVGQIKHGDVAPLEFVRGDLARDYTLRHVIHRSEWTQSALVPYRGASYFFLLVAYVPRTLWPGKPWPAPVYLTNDVFGRREDERLSWGFGLGFLEELIMNFGYVGVLGCFLVGRLCAWLDRRIYGRSSFFAILWIPLVFACAFASSVVLPLIIFVVIPALLLSPVLARRTRYATITNSLHPGRSPRRAAR